MIIAGCYPILVIFLSILILHEKFYFRYIIGIFVCIIGSGIIILNERNSGASKIKLKDNIWAGFFFAMYHLLVNGYSGVGQKVLCKENLSPDEQNYYLGIPALFLCS